MKSFSQCMHGQSMDMPHWLMRECLDLTVRSSVNAVTLLALGNGAPDLSACIAAVSSGRYRLALGALLGDLQFTPQAFNTAHASQTPNNGPGHGCGAKHIWSPLNWPQAPALDFHCIPPCWRCHLNMLMWHATSCRRHSVASRHAFHLTEVMLQ